MDRRLSTRTKRITRKARGTGGIVTLTDTPDDKQKGDPVVIDWVPYVELIDGRLARTEFPRLDWRIVNGALVRDGAHVHKGQVLLPSADA